MSAGTVCSRVVATATADETVRVAARRMAKHDVGTLVVLGTGDGIRPIGVLTDRDVVVRCVASEMAPDQATIGEVMSRPAQTVDEHTSLDEALARMARTGIRRLVVTGEAGRLAGVLSLDDVLERQTRQAAAVGQILAAQQPNVPA